jgi:hypothetical protein
LGTLSNGQSIQVDEYIQQVASRKFDGDREDTFLVSDQQDWFLVRASVAGKLKVSFTQSAILDAVGVPLFVGYFAGMMPGPAPIPPEGVSVSPGTDHYVLVYAKPNITQTEFGFKYHLDISLQAN